MGGNRKATCNRKRTGKCHAMDKDREHSICNIICEMLEKNELAKKYRESSRVHKSADSPSFAVAYFLKFYSDSAWPCLVSGLPYMMLCLGISWTVLSIAD